MKQWFVVETKPGDQDRAEENLLSQMFETLNPKALTRAMVRGKLTEKVVPVFDGYMFVWFDPAEQAAKTINHTRGVSRLLTFGDVMVPVSAKIIDELKQTFPRNNLCSLDQLTKGGDRVKVKGLEALEAAYVEPSGKKRAMLLVNLLGRQIPVKINH